MAGGVEVLCGICGAVIRQRPGGAWMSRSPAARMANPWMISTCYDTPMGVALHRPFAPDLSSREAIEEWLDADS